MLTSPHQQRQTSRGEVKQSKVEASNGPDRKGSREEERQGNREDGVGICGEKTIKKENEKERRGVVRVRVRKRESLECACVC